MSNKIRQQKRVALSKENEKKKKSRIEPVSCIVLILIVIIISCWTYLIRSFYVDSKYEKTSSTSLSYLKSTPREQSYKANKIPYKPNELPRSTPGISACLLIKDENSNLQEWLAYHYFTLPLRYLVVAIDPTSSTSPLKIFQKWKPFMDIQIWNDREIFYGETFPKTTNKTKLIAQHRRRQKWFMMRCMQYHYKKKRSWTILIDTDEYISFNRVSLDTDSSELFEKNSETITAKTPVSQELFSRLLNDFGKAAPHKHAKKAFEEKLKARTRIPPIANETKISSFIYQEQKNLPWSSTSCIVLPRLTFGNTLESDVSKLYNPRIIPAGFSPKNFNTLTYFRYSFHGLKNKIDGPGKSFVDVSRLSKMTISRNMTRCVHSVVRECGIDETSAYPMLDDAIVRVHHYSMSLENFFSKEDSRRTQDMYDKRANAQDFTSYDVQSWLLGFITEIGYQNALELLDGAGGIAKSE